MTDLLRLPATRLAELVRGREVSPVEVVDIHLACIEAVNPVLNAITTLLDHQARIEARQAEAALRAVETVGPLHGVPITIKECFDMAEGRSTGGVTWRANYVGMRDATAVARMRAAGTIILARTNIPDASLAHEATNPIFGRTNNPWAPTRSTGGSSGGEAATIAAGGSPLGIGTDMGGSVRLPSALCGVVGFKPSHRLIPSSGNYPRVPDALEDVSAVGPLGRTVGDVALAASIMAERPELATPDDFDLPFKDVTFAARDGVRLGGWLIGQGQRPTIVFCAGLFGSMDGDVHMAPHFVRAGFNVLQFDWRGHGISGGQRVTLGLREQLDLLGALDYLQSQGVGRVGLLGFSMGGAVALRVAAEDARIACVVCDGGFAKMESALVGYVLERTGGRGEWLFRAFARLVLMIISLRLGKSMHHAEPLPVVEAIAPRPVLFIHGADDPFVPIADQEALYAACGEPKELWRVADVGHRETYDFHPDEYIARVVAFFRAGLRGAP